MTNTNVTRGYGLLEKFLAKKRARIANKFIPSSLRKGKILDIGCGTIPFFLIHTKFAHKFGIDPFVNNDIITKKINLKRFDIEKNIKLPFNDNYFDVITMLAVFEHIEPDKLTDILKEIRRVLKIGGRFILTTPCPWTDKILRIMTKLRLVSKKEIEEHKGAYPHSSLISYFVNAGFDKSKIKLGYFEFYLNTWAYVDK